MRRPWPTGGLLRQKQTNIGNGCMIVRILYRHRSKRLANNNNNNLADSGIGGRIILRWTLQEVGSGSMDWIDVAHDRDRRRTLVNAVMNLRFP